MNRPNVKAIFKIASTALLPGLAAISMAQQAAPTLGVSTDFKVLNRTMSSPNDDTSSGDSGKEFCLWLGSPTMFEAKVPGTQIGVAAGLAPWEVRTMDQFGETTNLTLGLGGMVQLAYYSKSTLDGVAYFVRAGNADGTSYFAPGVAWVSRTAGSGAYRYGFAFPIGSNIFPFVAEFAYGIQF